VIDNLSFIHTQVLGLHFTNFLLSCFLQFIYIFSDFLQTALYFSHIEHITMPSANDIVIWGFLSHFIC